MSGCYWLTSWRCWHWGSHWDQSWQHNKNWHLHHNKQSSQTADRLLLKCFHPLLRAEARRGEFYKIIVLRSWMRRFDQLVVFTIKGYGECLTVDSWIFSCCWSWNIYSPRTVIWSDRCCFAHGQNPINLSIWSHIELERVQPWAFFVAVRPFNLGPD